MRNNPGHNLRTIRLLLTLLVGVLWLLGVAGCATPPVVPEDRALGAYPADLPFANSRFMTVDEIRIHYRVFEPNGEPTGKLLLLHGLGGSTFSFQDTAPGLASAGYSVVVVDEPGFGFSDVVVELKRTLENRADLLWRFLDRLDGENSAFVPTVPWIVIGHSTGAQAAVQLAIDRPSRIAGLVIIAGSLDPESFPLCCIWFPPVRWGLRSWLSNGVFTYDGVEELLSDSYGREATMAEVDGYLAPLLRDEMGHSFSRFLQTSFPWEIPIEQIAVPSLVIWGSEDSWIDVETGSAVANRIPGAVMQIIEGAGHIPFETHPEETIRAMVDWLDRMIGREPPG